MNGITRKIVERFFILGAFFVCLGFFLSSSTQVAQAQSEELFLPFSLFELNEDADAPLCRLGVNATSNVSGFDLGSLRAGWYMNFNTTLNPPRPNGIDYLPVIRVCPSGVPVDAQRYPCYPDQVSAQDVTEWATSLPGSAWFIGNEPDRPDYIRTGQDAALPEDYARSYHELYYIIKAADPSAKILAGSIVQPTAVRLKYLDLILDAYRDLYGTYMPVDGWSIHNYILNEKSCAHFPRSECWGAEIPPGVSDTFGLVIDAQQNDDFNLFVTQIENFRVWMARNGYRNTPLYLSEFGVLMPAGVGFDPDFDAPRVNAFMTKTIDYLRTATDSGTGYPADNNRLVQTFSWYSTTDSAFNGQLFDRETRQLTDIGKHLADYMAIVPLEADFYPLSLTFSPSTPVVSGNVVSVTLQTAIANSGNNLSPYDVRVQFYQGDPANGGTKIGSDQIVSLAGCGDVQTASVVWEDAPLELTQIYVSVAPVNIATTPESELARANNVMSFALLTGGEKSYLPQVSR